MKRCTVKGCKKEHVARGYCINHYQRWRRNGDPVIGPGTGLPGKPKKLRNPTGIYITKNGYRKVRGTDRRWRLEHHYVMEKILGRSLYPGESIHHKNGNRLDNRPGNLELWLKPQPCGIRVADAIKWAKEILIRYA